MQPFLVLLWIVFQFRYECCAVTIGLSLPFLWVGHRVFIWPLLLGLGTQPSAQTIRNSMENFLKAELFSLETKANLYNKICNHEHLILAYKNLRNFGIDKLDTLFSSISTQTIQHISLSLSSEEYRFHSKTRIQDSIVQEAIRLILEEDLRIESFKYIKNNFHDTTWLIQGSLKKPKFIDYFKLMKIIENKIIDPRLTKLIWNYLESGLFDFYVDPHPYPIFNDKKSILNPVLTNIYLEQLDIFLNDLSPVLKPVRFYNHFLLGIQGSKSQAIDIRNRVETFIRNMGLKKGDLQIINLYEDRALFIGTHIFYGQGGKIRLEAPMKIIMSKLKEAGFMKNGKAHPQFRWYHLTHKQILVKYNSLLKTICNYYSFVHNSKSLLRSLSFFLKSSCAKLLAAKFKLRTQSKVFSKFGKDLRCPNSNFFFQRPG